MNIGTQTNSLVNHLLSGSKSPEPVVGMGCTLLHWTDRSPATVIEVGKNYIVVQADNFVRTDKNGFSESQKYEFTANPNGATYTFKFWKGRWQSAHISESGRLVMSKDGSGISLGQRGAYHDFTF